MKLILLSLLLLSSMAVAKSSGPTCEERLTASDRVFSTLFGVSSKPWALSQKTEEAIQRNFLDDQRSDILKMREAIELMLLDRANKIGSKKKLEKLYDAIDSSFDGDVQAEKRPIYDPVSNEVCITPLNDEHLPATAILHAHELDHAFVHQFSHMKSQVLWHLAGRAGEAHPEVRLAMFPILNYRMEQSAIGAQWELVHRIPQDMRYNMILELIHEGERDPLANEKLHEIMLQSLSRANLSKADFIAQMESYHNYTLAGIRTKTRKETRLDKFFRVCFY